MPDRGWVSLSRTRYAHSQRTPLRILQPWAWLGPHLSLKYLTVFGEAKSAFLPFSISQLIHNLYKNLSLPLRKCGDVAARDVVFH